MHPARVCTRLYVPRSLLSYNNGPLFLHFPGCLRGAWGPIYRQIWGQNIHACHGGAAQATETSPEGLQHRDSQAQAEMDGLGQH